MGIIRARGLMLVAVSVLLNGCAGRNAADANARGGNCFDRGDLRCALAEYRVAIADDPENAAYHNAYGATLARAGRVDQAISEFETALRLDPTLTKASDNLATAHRSVERRRASLIASEMRQP